MESLDIRVFFIEAISTNSDAISKLDEVYKKYKSDAYEIAKRSSLYNHPIVIDGDIFKEVASKRMLGLVLLASQNQEMEFEILSIIKSGWPYLYRYLKNKKEIDLKETISKFLNDQMSEDEKNALPTIVIILCQILDIKIKDSDFFDKFLEAYYLRYQHYENNEIRRIQIDNLDDETISKAESIVDRCFEKYGNITSTDDINLISDQEMSLYIETLSIIYDTENLMFLNLSNNVEIERSVLVEIAAVYYLNYKNQNRVEAMKFIIASIYIKYTLKAYNEVKKYHFENNQESMFFEIDSLIRDKEKLRESNDVLKSKIEYLENELRRLKTTYKNSIELDLIEKDKVIHKLTEQVSELLKDKDELFSLRDTLFSKETDSDIEQIVTKKIDLAQIKVIIFGGHPDWANKMNEVLPDSFSIMEGDVDFDDAVINHIDAVFFKYDYMSHSIYNKAVKAAKKNDVHIGYIKSNAVDYSINEIMTSLEQKGKTNES